MVEGEGGRRRGRERDRETERQRGRGRQADRQTGRQADRRTDRPTDRGGLAGPFRALQVVYKDVPTIVEKIVHVPVER